MQPSPARHSFHLLSLNHWYPPTPPPPPTFPPLSTAAAAADSLSDVEQRAHVPTDASPCQSSVGRGNRKRDIVTRTAGQPRRRENKHGGRRCTHNGFRRMEDYSRYCHEFPFRGKNAQNGLETIAVSFRFHGFSRASTGGSISVCTNSQESTLKSQTVNETTRNPKR